MTMKRVTRLGILDMLLAVREQVGGAATLNQVIVLAFIVRNGPSRQREIMEACGLPRSTVSRIVIDFQADGLLTEQDNLWSLSEYGERRRAEMWVEMLGLDV